MRQYLKFSPGQLYSANMSMIQSAFPNITTKNLNALCPIGGIDVLIVWGDARQFLEKTRPLVAIQS
jgi:hypothetical protein